MTIDIAPSTRRVLLAWASALPLSGLIRLGAAATPSPAPLPVETGDCGTSSGTAPLGAIGRWVGPFASEDDALAALDDTPFLDQEATDLIVDAVDGIDCDSCAATPTCEGWVWADATHYWAVMDEYEDEYRIVVFIDSPAPGDPQERQSWVVCSNCEG